MDKFLTKAKRKVEEVVGGKEEETGSPKTKTTKLENVLPERDLVDWLNIPVETLKDNKEYEDYFTLLANHLLNNVVLRINKQPHRLLEIEFYFTNDEPTDGVLIHHDPFTHCDKIQQQSGVWYFHKTGNNYRGGSYKGIDIAIGRGEGKAGGILIRSVQSLSDGKVTCGPSLTVDHILSVCKVQDIKTLVSDNLGGSISALPRDDKNGTLFLERSDSFDKTTVYRSGRVGLHMTKKNEDKELQKEFVFKHYRYFVEPKKISKGCHYATVALLYKGYNVGQIAQILPTKAPTVERYKKLFEEGKEMSEDKFVDVKMSDQEICSAYGSLHNILTW